MNFLKDSWDIIQDSFGILEIFLAFSGFFRDFFRIFQDFFEIFLDFSGFFREIVEGFLRDSFERCSTGQLLFAVDVGKKLLRQHFPLNQPPSLPPPRRRGAT